MVVVGSEIERGGNNDVKMVIRLGIRFYQIALRPVYRQRTPIRTAAG